MRAKKGKGKGKLDWSFEDEDEDYSTTKTKGKKKDKSSSSSSAASGEFDIDPIFNEMTEVYVKFEEELKGLKIGKAEPSLVQNLTLDGQKIQAYGQIQVKDPFTLAIALYDTSIIPKLIKAIQAFDPNLNPNHDNHNVFISVPRPTSEYRKSLIKKLSVYTENAKNGIRNVRRDANSQVKKAKYPEDEARMAERQIQSAHDEFIKKIDKLAKQKESELTK